METPVQHRHFHIVLTMRSSYRGRWLDNYFCPRCGSMLFSYFEALPDIVGIAQGNFEPSDLASPTMEFWTECRHSWLTIGGLQEHYRRQPKDEENTGPS